MVSCGVFEMDIHPSFSYIASRTMISINKVSEMNAMNTAKRSRFSILLLAGLGLAVGLVAFGLFSAVDLIGLKDVARPPMAKEQLSKPDNAPPTTVDSEANAALSNPLQESALDSGEVEVETWNRFRGPNGTGIYAKNDIATNWNDSENVHWSTPLPGAGSSSPVLTEKFVFVTSYSGYGAADETGSIAKLKRHLSCIERATGKILWTVGNSFEPYTLQRTRYR